MIWRELTKLPSITGRSSKLNTDQSNKILK